MDLSNIQPTFKKFDNEIEAEKFLSKLSMMGGKKIDVINIYAKGSSLYVWFYYDRKKLGYSKPVEEAEEKAAQAVKKKTTKKKTRKKASKS